MVVLMQVSETQVSTVWHQTCLTQCFSRPVRQNGVGWRLGWHLPARLAREDRAVQLAQVLAHRLHRRVAGRGLQHTGQTVLRGLQRVQQPVPLGGESGSTDFRVRLFMFLRFLRRSECF